jgi:hypothetical protein
MSYVLRAEVPYTIVLPNNISSDNIGLSSRSFLNRGLLNS